MSVKLTHRRIRLKFDAAAPAETVFDQLTEANPQVFNGNAAQFGVACFYGAELLDLSVYAQLTLTIKTSVAANGYLYQVSVPAADFNPDLTCDQWAAQSGQHAAFEIDSLAADLTSSNVTLWLVLAAQTTTGNEITLGSANLIIVPDGTGNAAAPDATDQYYTKAQTDALVALNALDLSAYTITRPAEPVRTFDPHTASMDTLYNFVATLAADIKGEE